MIHQPFSRTSFVYFSKILLIWKLHILWLAKPYGLANQKLCYIQTPLDIEKSEEQV